MLFAMVMVMVLEPSLNTPTRSKRPQCTHYDAPSYSPTITLQQQNAHIFALWSSLQTLHFIKLTQWTDNQ